MKQFFIVCFLFAAFAIRLDCYAQSDPKLYIDKVMEKLESADCDGARKFYNVYKELSGNSMNSIEEMLSDCWKTKTYSVGDIMMVGTSKYIVAYTRDGGAHGLAVYNRGWAALDCNFCDYIAKKRVPTLEELELIYTNRDKIRFYDIYWSCSRVDKNDKACRNGSYYYYAIDFSTGETKCRYSLQSDAAVLLLIHRFKKIHPQSRLLLFIHKRLHTSWWKWF